MKARSSLIALHPLPRETEFHSTYVGQQSVVGAPRQIAREARKRVQDKASGAKP